MHISLRFLDGHIRIFILHGCDCQSVYRLEHAIRFKIDRRVILCVCINMLCLRTIEWHVWLSVQQFVFDFFALLWKKKKLHRLLPQPTQWCWTIGPHTHTHTHDLRIHFFYLCFVEIMLACTHETHSWATTSRKGTIFAQRAIVSDDPGPSESDARLEMGEKNWKARQMSVTVRL